MTGFKRNSTQRNRSTEVAKPEGLSPPRTRRLDRVELLSVNDFLELFNMGRTSFYREVSAGRLAIVKFGSATRIRRSDAEAWLAQLPNGGSNADGSV